jgi:3-oxoacyl-[acyl-carrier-protein] synthase II
VCGRSGIAQIEPTLEGFDVRIGGQVRGFDPAQWMDAREARRHARFTQFALCAAKQAALDAGLVDAGYAPERVGVIVGAGLGGVEVFAEAVQALLERGPKRVSPLAAVSLYPNIAPGAISVMLGARGPCFSVTSACASSAHALGEAMNAIRRGSADAVVAGGAEASLSPVALAAFAKMRALSTRNDEPTKASRPFDRERDGFVMAEGGAILVLEELEAARARGARIYGELAGYGASADAFHLIQPREDGLGPQLAMRAALADAQVASDAVDYVNAHGTSTEHNDLVETRALRSVFAAAADALWVSSSKSMSGHMMGASAAFEAIVALLSMRSGVVHPTANLLEPGPGCDLDYVPGSAREKRVRTVLSNSFGFGGQNASLLFQAV